MARGADRGELTGRRVAVYARYSSDRQSESSIEDQVERCRRFVEERGGRLEAARVFADYAISGAKSSRPALDALLAAVEAEQLDVLVVEDQSRLSRDMEDAARVRKRLEYRGVRLLGVADGLDTGRQGSHLVYGLKSLISETYLHELADKTHRGMEGRARAGKVTGALPYGYVAVDAPDGNGKVAQVDPERAAVVVRIFELWASGESLAGIATALNVDDVPTPRRNGKGWVKSAVREMLANERYAGRWAWNTHEWLRDPTTGQRRYRARPRAEWITEDRPELRIVPEALWRAAAARFTRNAATYGGSHRKRQQYLLTGLLYCGACGAPMHVHGGGRDRRYYGCSRSRDRGTCTNRLSVQERILRERLLGVLHDRFTGPAARRRLYELVDERLRLAAQRVDSTRVLLEERVAKTERQLERLVDVLAGGGDSSTIRSRLEQLERRLRADRDELEAIARGPARLPGREIAARYALDFEAGIRGNVTLARERLRAVLQDGRIELHPRADGRYVARTAVYADLLLLGRGTPAQEPGRAFDDAGCGGPVWSLSNGRIAVPIELLAA